MTIRTLSFAAAITALALGSSAFAGELPTYAANGIPATPVQVGLLGATHTDMQQQAAIPPAGLTPVQASLLTPRKKVKTANAGEAQ